MELNTINLDGEMWMGDHEWDRKDRRFLWVLRHLGPLGQPLMMGTLAVYDGLLRVGMAWEPVVARFGRHGWTTWPYWLMGRLPIFLAYTEFHAAMIQLGQAARHVATHRLEPGMVRHLPSDTPGAHVTIHVFGPDTEIPDDGSIPEPVRLGLLERQAALRARAQEEAETHPTGEGDA